MTKEEIEVHLAEYVEGSLPETQARHVERWLAENPHVAEDIEAARFARSALQAMPSPSMPIELGERILRATSQRPSLMARVGQWFAALPAPVYASAMIAIVAGVLVYTQFTGQVAKTGALPEPIETVAVAHVKAEAMKNEATLKKDLGKTREAQAEAAAPSPAKSAKADGIFASLDTIKEKSGDQKGEMKPAEEKVVAGKLTATATSGVASKSIATGEGGGGMGVASGGLGAIGTVASGPAPAQPAPVLADSAPLSETISREAAPARDEKKIEGKKESASDKGGAQAHGAHAPAAAAPSRPPAPDIPKMVEAPTSPFDDMPGAIYGGVDRGMGVHPVSAGFANYAGDEMNIEPYIVDDTEADRDDAEEVEREMMAEEDEVAMGLAARVQPVGYGTSGRILGAVRTGGGEGRGTGTTSRRVERAEVPVAVEAPVIAEYEGQNSGWTRAQRVLVRDEATWEQLWGRVHTALASPPPLPPVDFSRQIVIGVSLGSRPTGGFAVDIVGVRRIGDRLIVRLRETQPAPGSMVAEAFTQPYALVVVDLEGPIPAGLKIEFTR